MGCRLLIVFSAFLLSNLVLNPDKALFALSRVFPRSALLLALTAKTIPHLGQQLQQAGEIQQCRGASYYRGNYIRRIKNRLPLLKVLFLSALEDSFNLSESIQARAYGSGARSSYFRFSFRNRDYIVMAASLCAAIFNPSFIERRRKLSVFPEDGDTDCLSGTGGYCSPAIFFAADPRYTFLGVEKMGLFQVENLTYYFPEKEKPSLQEINLKIEEGDFVFLTGQSGCGKSSLLRPCRPAARFYGGRIEGRSVIEAYL